MQDIYILRQEIICRLNNHKISPSYYKNFEEEKLKNKEDYYSRLKILIAASFIKNLFQSYALKISKHERNL